MEIYSTFPKKKLTMSCKRFLNISMQILIILIWKMWI